MRKLVFAAIAAFTFVSVGNAFASGNYLADGQNPAPTDTTEAPAPQPAEPAQEPQQEPQQQQPQQEPQSEPQQEPAPDSPAPSEPTSIVLM